MGLAGHRLRLGTFALLAVAEGLWILARISRSRALAVITLIYTRSRLPGRLARPARALRLRRPCGLLPAAVLLLAGLIAMTGAGLRALRSPNRIRPASL